MGTKTSGKIYDSSAHSVSVVNVPVLKLKTRVQNIKWKKEKVQPCLNSSDAHCFWFSLVLELSLPIWIKKPTICTPYGFSSENKKMQSFKY